MYIHFTKLVEKRINIFVLFSSLFILKHQLVNCKFILNILFFKWVKKFHQGFLRKSWSKEVLNIIFCSIRL